MKYSRLILLSVFVLIFGCNKKKISLSFDDAPTSDSFAMSGDERTNLIIKALKENDVKRVAFYSNTKRIPFFNGLERLKKYKKAGHLIGNHTHSHFNLSNTYYQNYLKDFELAHKILNEHGLLDKYFRYPFLSRGKTIEEVNSVRDYYTKKGYVDAFITVDNYDWYINDLYLQALKSKQNINFENLKKYYVETIYKSVVFYDKLAKKALGESINHVLLLHENDVAAMFIGDLIKKLKKEGWEITTPEKSYEDDVTKKFPHKILNHGRGRVFALAQETNYEKDLTSPLQNKKKLNELFYQYKVIE